MKKRFSGFEFWDGAVFGALLGIVITLLLCWTLTDLSKEFRSIWGYLFTAVVTLFVALIAFKGVRSQIETQLIIAERNRSQDLAANRATLPLALSKLTEISGFGMQASLSLANTNDMKQDEINALLRVPDDVLSTIQNCIKSSDLESQKWLAKILSSYQIYYSRSGRLASLEKPKLQLPYNEIEYERVSRLLDWAVFYALVSHVFNFARMDVDTIPLRLDVGNIWTAFRALNIQEDRYENLPKRIEDHIKYLGDATVDKFD